MEKTSDNSKKYFDKLIDSKNMLRIIIQFLDVSSISNLMQIKNKKIKDVLFTKFKIDVPIIYDFIEEIKFIRRINKARDIFFLDINTSTSSPYATNLRKQLSNKYAYSEVDQFISELLNFHFKKLCADGLLNLSWCSLGKSSENLKILGGVFKKNKNIIELNLSNNSLGKYSENFKSLCYGLKVNNTIKKLDLSDNFLGENSEIFKVLCDSLNYYGSITVLNLKYNSIGSNTTNLEYLSEGLKNYKNMDVLDLSCNNLGSNSGCFIILCKALRENWTINTLNIENNNLPKSLCKVKSDLRINNIYI